MVDPAHRAHQLRKQIVEERDRSLTWGRLTHGLYLTIMTLTVGSSALSAILALGFEHVNRQLIGAIALVPGICAGVADRFHLVLKKHWYYRRFDKLNTLVRRLNFVLPRHANNAEIGKIAEAFCRIDSAMSRAWEHLEEETQPAKAENRG